MDFLNVLRDSLNLLYKKPKIFIPNLCAAIMYAGFELVLIKISIEVLDKIISQSPEGLREVLASNILLILGALAFYPILAVIDLIVYAMYPSIVLDYHNKREISLIKALKSALHAWRIWLALGLVLLMFLLIVTPAISVLTFLSYTTGNTLLLIPAGIIFLAAVILLMLAVFFVMPIGIIEKGKTLETFRKSYRLGKKHRKEVLPIVVFSTVLVFLALLIGNTPAIKSGNEATYIAITLFVLIKMLQSLIYTYISVVNPYFYMKIREK